MYEKIIIASASIILTIFIVIIGIDVFVPKNIGVELDNNLDILYSVKSTKTKFEVDKVNLDFQYGHSDKLGGNISENEDFEFIGFALYFCDAKYYNKNAFTVYNITEEYIFEDYRNLEGFYLVKELSNDEFNSDDYWAKRTLFSADEFHHRETMTVPKEVFERKKGSVVFMVKMVYYMKEYNGYVLDYRGAVHFNYDFINENTVRISKPSSTLPN